MSADDVVLNQAARDAVRVIATLRTEYRADPLGDHGPEFIELLTEILANPERAAYVIDCLAGIVGATCDMMAELTGESDADKLIDGLLTRLLELHP